MHSFIARFLTNYNNPEGIRDDTTEYKNLSHTIIDSEIGSDEHNKQMKEIYGYMIYCRLQTYNLNQEYIWGVLDMIYEINNLSSAMQYTLKNWNVIDKNMVNQQKANNEFDCFQKIDIEVRKHYKMGIPSALTNRST